MPPPATAERAPGTLPPLSPPPPSRAGGRLLAPSVLYVSRPLRLLLAAAEPSGDALGAKLLAAARDLTGEIQVFAAAGPALLQAGAQPIARASDGTASGLFELFGRLPSLYAHRARLRSALSMQPDLLLTIDSPGLHLPLARQARARGIPTVHAVCPQIWASRPWRISALKRSVDHVLCLLPFEPALLSDRGIPSTFIGNPAARAWRPIPSGPATVLLAPGSRPAELRQHLPVLARVAEHLRGRRPDLRLIALCAPGISPTALDALRVPVSSSLDECSPHVAIAASGTITLELATTGIPQVVLYRVHPLTYAIGRPFLTTPWISLPNVLAQQAIVPEHLQVLDPSAIADQALALLGAPGQDQLHALQPALETVRVADGLAEGARTMVRLARREVASEEQCVSRALPEEK